MKPLFSLCLVDQSSKGTNSAGHVGLSSVNQAICKDMEHDSLLFGLGYLELSWRASHLWRIGHKPYIDGYTHHTCVYACPYTKVLVCIL